VSGGIIEALGLLEDGVAPVLDARSLSDLAERRLAFHWIHMGTVEIETGQMLRVLRDHAPLVAPRTGHIGNWDDIKRGRAGMVDYNKVVCEVLRAGYPLIYEFTQTEDAALEAGDWIYLPGSLVAGGRREALALYTFDGTRFVERSREQALFAPLTLTMIEGELVPLVSLHRRRMSELDGYDFRFQADLLHREQDTVRAILQALVEHARTERNPTAALGRVLDRVVTIDGIVRREPIKIDGSGYEVGGWRAGSTEELVSAVVELIGGASHPTTFLAQPSELLPAYPLPSMQVVALLHAVLESHYPNAARPAAAVEPWNTHPEWGAVGMAGYPPRARGHFANHVRQARPLYRVIIDEFPVLSPVLFMILPAAIFTCWPTTAHPQDIDLLGQLVQTAHKRTDHLRGRSNLMVAEMDVIVRDWYAEQGSRLSTYFVNRFSERRSVLHQGELPASSEPVMPAGFESLTVMQASMLVGALVSMLARSR
jgi:hypothetical protein